MFAFFKKKRSPCILIVDDEPSLVSTLKDRLEMSGFEVITASNGREGLEKAFNQKPDLILLDTMMPVMNGHEMLERLRENPKGREISVIMVTACGLIDNIDKADSFGVDDYVIKPFNAHELITKMNTILERKGVALV